MIPVTQLHEWTPKEIYKQFALKLLRDNPPVVEEITQHVMTKAGKRRRVVKKMLVGGYWSRFNKSCQVSHFYIYTCKIVDGRPKVIEVINYVRWRAIMDAYFLKARDCIIQGEALNIGNFVGRIEPWHIERNHANRKIDFHKTKQQPLIEAPDGSMRRERIIYHTADSYVRVGWRKARRLTNEKSYEFKPSRKNINGNGFQQIFSIANQDETLRLSYPYFPYIKRQTV